MTYPGDLRRDHGTEPGSSALFSTDDLYRYMLEREVMRGGPNTCRDCADTTVHGTCDLDGWPCDSDNKRRVVMCGLNPSTANAFKNDPTVTREVGFAHRLGCAIYVKVNAYGWRDKKRAGMWAAARLGSDIIGPDNDIVIRTALTMCRNDHGIAIACWGKDAKPARVRRLVEIARDVGIFWMCLGTNLDGSPKHPLYLPADTELVPWDLTRWRPLRPDLRAHAK